MTIAQTCGLLLVGGIPGHSLPDRYASALRERRRGGVVLFRRNVEGGVSQTAALARQVHAASPRPLLAIDQEGGRVARLRAPFLAVPPMKTVASWGDEALAERIAARVGAELTAVGITCDFAPVLDVDSRPGNPVIGDRAFGCDPLTCARFGSAWIRGLQRAGLLATAKHFPGHGDTSVDSHFDLPRLDHGVERLERIEWAPFRAAVQAGVAAVMTAHVIYKALDPDRPATLSAASCALLRGPLGFQGMIFSDDLEMLAIARQWPVGEAAVLAIAAGCDALLICQSEEKQEIALDALVAEAERSPAFRRRCEKARDRVLAARTQVSASPPDDEDIARHVAGPESIAVASEMARRLEG